MNRHWHALVVIIFTCQSLASGEQVTIAGMAVGPDGTPVGNAIVATEYVGDAGEVWAEARSGADGTFELTFETRAAHRTFVVVGKREGHALGYAFALAGEQVRMEMEDDPGALSGTVVDDAGNRLPGIEVQIYGCWLSERPMTQMGHLFGWQNAPGDVTDHDGRFEVRGLPKSARVRVRARGEGWAEHRMPAILDWPQVGDDLVIRLEPEAVITGHVRRDGAPVKGIEVVAAGESGGSPPLGAERCASAEDGSYTIKGLTAGIYEVEVVSPEVTTAGPAPFVELKAGERRTDVDFELTEGYLVEGTLTMADTGRPAVGARLVARMPWQSVYLTDRELWKKAVTNAAGRYRLRLPAGESEVYYQGNLEGYPGHRAEPSGASMELGEDRPRAELNFVLRPRTAARPQVSGIVTGPDGRPVAGAMVLGTESYYGPATRVPAYTDQQGRFSVGRAWEWLLVKDAEGRLAALALIEDPAEDIKVQLEPAAYATARVVDLEGNPVAGVEACAQLARDPNMNFDLPVTAASDENGLLRIGPLPTNLELRVKPSFEASDIAAGPPWDDLWGFSLEPLEPGETRELPRLVVNPKGRSLQGRVLDQNQEPVAGARVACTDVVGSSMATALSDDDGRFELRGLEASGEVDVVAVGPEGTTAYGMPCDPDLPFEPEFRLEELGAAQGVIYGADGKPQAQVWVGLSTHEFFPTEALPRSLRTRGLTLSDNQGRWRFEGLIPGLEYRVSACDHRTEITGGPEAFVASGGPEPTVMEVRLK